MGNACERICELLADRPAAVKVQPGGQVLPNEPEPSANECSFAMPSMVVPDPLAPAASMSRACSSAVEMSSCSHAARARAASTGATPTNCGTVRKQTGGIEPCFQCDGRGFCHMCDAEHNAGSDERCPLCIECPRCGGSGVPENPRGRMRRRTVHRDFQIFTSEDGCPSVCRSSGGSGIGVT
eukprot:gnl/TRDRNA2_/TRDRNA2_193481_c0_seq1.p1 gnl/TRDRNA2_/TRDRNA2_193481_c0~~gnl/TRDRNA2_/TRDRNA2_193481_c0_seq1.p1  ORF type:complete len:182 (+),score=14.62 gnl/TRDRNA2_/TRDRNA2_193481_c0_seq1:62-607(+)